LNAVIDPDRNIVSGSTGDRFIIAVRIVSATLVETEQGIRVSLASKTAMGRSIDFEPGAKRRAKSAMVWHGRLVPISPILRRLKTPDTPRLVAPLPTPPRLSLAEIAPQPPAPSAYGHVLAPKRGMTLLVYGLLGMACCQILSPFTVQFYSLALKDYRVNGDPETGVW
jgi:hypothetical protein